MARTKRTARMCSSGESKRIRARIARYGPQRYIAAMTARVPQRARPSSPSKHAKNESTKKRKRKRDADDKKGQPPNKKQRVKG